MSSDLAIQKTVCGNLEKKVKSLEIQISKDEQYNRRNCVEFSGIPDTINDDKLEDTIIEACKDINIDVSETDIEACHRLPVRRNATNASKRVIVKFVNRKHAESILTKKLTLSSTDFSRLNINNKVYVNPSLCPYYRYISGRCKDLKCRKMIHHVFCLLSDRMNIFYFILGIDQGPLQQLGRFSFFTAFIIMDSDLYLLSQWQLS